MTQPYNIDRLNATSMLPARLNHQNEQYKVRDALSSGVHEDHADLPN